MTHLQILLIASLFLFSANIVSGQASETNGLNARQQSIVAISAFTAKGDLAELKKALNDGLAAGMTINEIKEELIHLSAYCGFPRSLNGIITFNTVLEERKSKGIKDVTGITPSKVADNNKYKTGKKVLESLTGQPERNPKTGYAAFVPAIDTLLKEHLFNDIFARGVINNEERELTTISALISMGGVDSQMQGHMGIGLHLGFTEEHLRQVLSIIEVKIGSKEAEVGRQVLIKVLASKR